MPGIWLTVNTKARATAWSSVSWTAVVAARTAAETSSRMADSIIAPRTCERNKRLRLTPVASSTSTRPACSRPANRFILCTAATATSSTVTTVSRDMNCSTADPEAILPT